MRRSALASVWWVALSAVSCGGRTDTIEGKSGLPTGQAGGGTNSGAGAGGYSGSSSAGGAGSSSGAAAGTTTSATGGASGSPMVDFCATPNTNDTIMATCCAGTSCNGGCSFEECGCGGPPCAPGLVCCKTLFTCVALETCAQLEFGTCGGAACNGWCDKGQTPPVCTCYGLTGGCPSGGVCCHYLTKYGCTASEEDCKPSK